MTYNLIYSIKYFPSLNYHNNLKRIIRKHKEKLEKIIIESVTIFLVYKDYRAQYAIVRNNEFLIKNDFNLITVIQISRSSSSI